MLIQISELHRICDELFKHLQSIDINTTDISEDYYWEIVKEQKYNVLSQPSNFTIGQLSDDWQQLQTLLNENPETVVYMFVWLANIMRVIGEEYPG